MVRTRAAASSHCVFLSLMPLSYHRRVTRTGVGTTYQARPSTLPSGLPKFRRSWRSPVFVIHWTSWCPCPLHARNSAPNTRCLKRDRERSSAQPGFAQQGCNGSSLVVNFDPAAGHHVREWNNNAEDRRTQEDQASPFHTSTIFVQISQVHVRLGSSCVTLYSAHPSYARHIS